MIQGVDHLIDFLFLILDLIADLTVIRVLILDSVKAIMAALTLVDILDFRIHHLLLP